MKILTKYKIISQGQEALSEIQISPELKEWQDSMPSDESLELVVESIRQNGFDQTKPIECYQDPKTGTFFVLRGWTRFNACIQLKDELDIKTIPVLVLDVPPQDRENFVIQDNLARRQMTTEQKKVIARKVLVKNPEMSDRKIASITGISDKTVKVLRDEMMAHSENPNVSKVDSMGRKVTKKNQPKKSHSENPNVSTKTTTPKKQEATPQPNPSPQVSTPEPLTEPERKQLESIQDRLKTIPPRLPKKEKDRIYAEFRLRQLLKAIPDDGFREEALSLFETLVS